MDNNNLACLSVGKWAISERDVLTSQGDRYKTLRISACGDNEKELEVEDVEQLKSLGLLIDRWLYGVANEKKR